MRDFHQRVFAVSGAIAHGQIPAAMVRRHLRNMCDLFALLSGAAAGRILLCPSNFKFLSPRRAGEDSSGLPRIHHSVDSIGLAFLGFSALAGSIVETGPGRSTDRRNPEAISR